MNKNKILIELEIPFLEKKFDLFIPINKRVGTIKKLIEDSLKDLTGNEYEIREDTNLYSKDTGDIYDVNKNVRDTDLQNGSRVILI